MRGPDVILMRRRHDACPGKIWDAPPADLEGVARAHRPPSQNMVKRHYANFDLYWTAGFLHFMSRHVREDRAGWAESSRLVAAIAGACARRLDLWNCTVGRVGAPAGRDVVAAAATVEEGLEIVDATVLYLNTLSSWLDASIPWSGIDVLPAVDVGGLRP